MSTEAERAVDLAARSARSILGAPTMSVSDLVRDMHAQGICDVESAAVVEAQMARLHRAAAADDLEQLVGVAKETCETIARVVLKSVGGVEPTRPKYPTLINTAHAMLERDPALMIKGSPEQAIVGRTRALAISVGELRNQVGTGHGRARPSGVPLDIAMAAVDGAAAWCAWACRRLLGSMTTPTLSALLGSIASRSVEPVDFQTLMRAIDLTELLEPAQRRAGVEVGRSAQNAPFAYRHEAVRIPARNSRSGRWPLPYRLGLLDGVLTTRDSSLVLDEFSVELVAEIMRSDLGNAALKTRFSIIVADGMDFGVDPALLTEQRRSSTLEAVRRQAETTTGDVQVAWRRLENLLMS